MSRFGGIDIGGTSIKYGLVINGKVKKKYEELTPQTEEALRILLKEIIRKLTLEKVAGIGIGFPGYIDQIKKRYIWGPNLKFKVNLGELVEQVNHNKLKIDNDGNLGALGEYENYYKGKVDNLIYVSFVLTRMIYKLNDDEMETYNCGECPERPWTKRFILVW